MIENSSINKPVSDETIELIARRVADYKKNKETSKLSTDDVNSHIDALSEVFDLDKNDVELIAKDVLIKQNQVASFKDQFYDKLIKYAKEVLVSIIIVLIVSFLLLGRSAVQPQLISHISNPTPDYSLMVKKSKIGSVLASISNMKIYITEYYMGEGQYPTKFEEIGFNKDENIKTKYVEDMKLGKNGSIIVKLKKSIGTNVVISLSPHSTMGGTAIEWQCHTNFSAYIQGCEKTKMSQYLNLFKK